MPELESTDTALDKHSGNHQYGIIIIMFTSIQLVLLLKDTDEEGAFGRTHAASIREVDRRVGTILTTFKGDTDLESKITSLQKMLKERDATIVQLRDEIAVMKVIIAALQNYNHDKMSCIYIVLQDLGDRANGENTL